MGRRNTSAEAEVAQMVLKEFESLRSNRGNEESRWQENAERIWPQQARLFLGQKDSGTVGEKRTEHIFDSTPVTSLNRFGAICDSLMTPRNNVWARLVPTDKTLKRDRTVMMYFEEVNEILFRLRYAPKANFASQNQMTYKMLGAYGNSAMYIDPLQDVYGEKGFRYRNVHLSEIWFRENHQGIVDSVVRQTRVTARQMCQWFGEEKCPDSIVAAAKTGKDTKYMLYHHVKPRKDYDGQRSDAKGMPFASYYVSGEGNHLLEEKGYACFPYAISRYEQISGEVYGRSPADDVLPAIKTLNEEKKTMLKQGHRASDPPLFAYDDGMLDGFSIRPGFLNPGGVSADGRMLVHTLPVGNVQAGKEMMDDERETIKAAFLVDLFQILEETPEMTATEVMERVKEKAILLTPVLGRQESEYLGPMIERELAIAATLKLLPPPPRKLREAGGHYHLEYDSPLSRAAKAEQSAGYMRTLENAIEVAQQTQDPSILDHFDFDEITPDVAYINGMPSRWLRGADKIAAIRAGRQQQMQQEAATRAAPGNAAMIKATAAAHKASPRFGNQVQSAITGQRADQEAEAVSG